MSVDFPYFFDFQRGGLDKIHRSNITAHIEKKSLLNCPDPQVFHKIYMLFIHRLPIRKSTQATLGMKRK